MIAPAEAKKIIVDSISSAEKTETVSLVSAIGRCTAKDIVAPVSLPPFDNSAVDGYAVQLNENDDLEWEVAGEIKAGDIAPKLASSKQAFQIFTGAPVPEGANTVIMQEHSITDKKIIRPSLPPVKGSNIRIKGSQIEQGAVAIRKGTVVSPATVGFISSLGITHVEVSAAPVVGIIVTGNELTLPGAILEEGKIYESNSYMLEAALRASKVENIHIYRSEDNTADLLSILKKACTTCDVILLTGGISVGKYDLVKQCLQQVDVKEKFYKIAQKPGKPMYFGMRENIPVFALPGNPAAVLTCFYEYVYPALKKITGATELFLPEIVLPLAADIQKKAGLANFLKGKIMKEGVMPLTGQESFILKSFSEADCLIHLPAHVSNMKKGELVEVHLVPFI